MSYEIEFYRTPSGDCPLDELLDSIEEKHRLKVEAFIDLLQQRGPNLPRPYADILREKIRELRVGFGRVEYRLLYFFADKTIVITHGFVKKTQKVPPEEISRAEHSMADWFRRQEE